MVGRAGEGAPSIGRPVSNTRVYIVDGVGSPAPVGVAGELYIGGDGLARGYLNRPALTAERFVPDPFSGEPGARLYRTGDLARYLPSGEIEFLGRVDHQVKVRGFRIELGEIEAALAECAGVRQTVVVAREDAPGDKRLVAYVVGDREAFKAADARSRLKERLPHYMMPSSFVLLEEWPLTPSGKVDRRRLPAPDVSAWEDGRAFESPRTPVEDVLAGIYEQTLGVRDVGVHDNFFELGGHSLLAMQVVSRLNDAFNLEAPLHALFESPTVAALAEHVEASIAGGRLAAAAAPVMRAPRGVAPTLSYQQRRLWFLAQLEPDDPSYNMAGALRLEGPLDAAALEWSFNEVVSRHEALRTSFVKVDGEPAPSVEPVTRLTLTSHDLSALPEGAKRERVDALLREEAERPFDLERCPLLRTTLLRLADDEHVLLLTMHHIVSDGWSLGVLLRELKTFYESRTAGEPAELPELPVQYADYALWQRERLEGGELERQLAYWEERLAGLPEALELPTDGPRRPSSRRRGGVVEFSLPAGLTASLKTLSRREGATLFMTLLAGFEALLYRHTGQGLFAVGTPVAGRGRAEVRGLVGFFVNTLALRAEVRGGETFAELLGRVRGEALGGYGRQEAPFERVVERLSPARALGRSPIFQVMLALDNTPQEELRLGALRVERLPSNDGAAKYDLSLSLREEGGVLGAMLSYDAGLFDEATVRSLAERYRVLLEGAAADPARRVSELPLLTEEETRRLLVEWNETRRDYPADATVHELFERQARLTPHAPALVFEAERVTYAELDERASRLAAHLRRGGVGAESRVGVLLERSTELVVGLLGVLKAGGAYVPLDPEYPAERLRFMAEDAGLSLVLTGGKLSELAAALAQGAGAAVVRVDESGDEPAGVEEDMPRAAVSPDNLAYVIYTSGSTGRPKGAMLAHRGVVNRLLWMQDAYGLTPHDRVMQKTPYSFDVSVWEFFWPLLAGATLVVARPGGHRDAAYLVRTIADERITTLHFVPSMLQAFLREEGLEACRSLRRVVCSGEALSHETQERFFAALDAELHNLYGPTEASIDVTYWECERGGGRRTVPIGRPIANTRLYILDGEMRPAPVGVRGELHLGGVALARGYHARPGLTAEKFVPDPFSSEGGARLYRTGDVARYLPDGAVEFLGRADGQVKVRGFRVELGEIEAALAGHELVSDAVVAALGGESEPDGRLVAYVVAGDERRPPAPAELRAYLKEKLPEYMIPHDYVPLDALPLTPSGKIDRRALPTPERSRAAAGQDYAPPGTEVEELLAGIWAEVLRVERVGVQDDFFALGGHSLLATRIISRVRDLFKVETPLQTFFAEPTVAGLGRSVAAALSAARGEAPPPIERAPRAREMPLSLAQQRLWFIAQLDPNSVAYNIPAAVRLTGPLNAHALERAFAEVVRRHEPLRTTFETVEGGPVQVIAEEGAPPPMPLADLRAFEAARREAEVARLAGEEARRPFDLERGPLLRTTLLRLAEDEHVLLLTMHHIVSDGWSMGVLVGEVAALYEAFAGGSPSPLPELPLQYVDFAVWQNERLRGGALALQLEYWARQLKGAPPTLELPADRRRPAVQSFHGAVCSLELPAELSGSLRALCRREGVTMFMTLLAAFKGLLARYAGRRDVVVGTPVAGRNQTETEPLIGFFVNTLVLRTDLSGDPSFVELLRRVREVVLGALAHQDVPFERLVEELQPERSMSHSPLFQVAFATPTSELRDLEFSGLRLQPVGTDAQTSKFDLTLQVEAGERLVASLEYNTDLFDAGTIRRLLGHYEALLQGVAADPARPLSRLLRLDEGERRQAIAAGRGARRDYTIAPVHRLFERQAEAAPNRVAVADGAAQLTYGELNARANQLARALRRMGVGREVRVGVLLERGVEMLVAWLGVMKAGGAYVPLEPAYPQDRLRFMQHDAGLEVVLTEERLRGLCDEEASAFLSLDGGREAVGRESGENLPDGADAGSLVYVIYTSGSTGRPKGVEIEHRGLANLVGWVRDEYGLGGEFTASQVTSPGFDASAWEVWTCLTAGGSLHIADDLTRASAPALLEWLDAKGVEVCFLPTVMAEAVLGRQSPLPPSLKILFTAGDRLHRGLERELPFGVFNLYGPTENTVAATGAPVPVSGESGAPPPIGRPVANTEAYVLDERLEPAPAGVPGELYLGGAGLARCYLKRPALTAERFVPHPFGRGPGERLYRTGDVARHLPDGNIEYLGRADEQLKLRGYRIEPGEIESALTQHPGVREAVVLMREDRPGDRRLAAYLVATGEPVPRADLSNHLAEKLPRHMIPSAFVFLDSLPLTASGKVDKRALPKPSGDKEAGDYVEPRNIKEQALADIWQLLLGVERVGARDDFFELGGNSLLMMQVIARVKKVFDVSLPVAAFYQSPTVESLAEQIRKLQRSPLLEAGINLTRDERPAGRHPVIVELQPAGSNPPFFLAHTLGGHLGDCLELAQELGALDQPVYGLQARGLDDDAEPYTRIEEMATSYADAVLSVQAEGPFRLGGYCSGGLLAFEVARRLRERGHEVELLALIGAQPTPGGSVSLADMRRDPEVLPIVAFCGELKIAVGEDVLRALDSTGRREKVWEEFRLQSPEYAENLGRTMFERLYRVYVADAVALINNVPRPYAGRVVLFDFMEHHEGLSQRAAWDELCLGPLERQEVLGNHITAMRRPNVRLLAQKLNASLNAPRRVALKRNRGTRQKVRPEAAS
ncbi:MAG TPA: amino acid adenylation domain-containing protein [Pyrinomonadaceae bacterium]